MHITILRKDIGDFHLWNADFRLTGMVISNGRTGDGFHSGILIFISVKWKKYVTDQADGYWEKGMTSVPLVAYTLTDKTTYKKVKDHFDYKDEAQE